MTACRCKVAENFVKTCTWFFENDYKWKNIFQNHCQTIATQKRIILHTSQKNTMFTSNRSIIFLALDLNWLMMLVDCVQEKEVKLISGLRASQKHIAQEFFLETFTSRKLSAFLNGLMIFTWNFFCLASAQSITWSSSSFFICTCSGRQFFYLLAGRKGSGAHWLSNFQTGCSHIITSQRVSRYCSRALLPIASLGTTDQWLRITFKRKWTVIYRL